MLSTPPPARDAASAPLSWAVLVRKALRPAHVGHLLRAWALMPAARRRPFVIWRGRVLTYAAVYRQAQRYAQLFRAIRRGCRARGELEADSALHIGIYQENAPTFLFAVFGAALAGDLVFALNTGFRGDVLAGVLEQSAVKLLITSPAELAQVQRAISGRPGLGHVRLLLDAERAPVGMETLEEALAGAARVRDRTRTDAAAPLLVLYTSGTSGLPKAIGCSHLKLWGAAWLTAARLGLRPTDRGYLAMPLFHSNAWLLGVMPLLLVGGSFVLAPHFSARAFEQDALRYGVTYLNYVGQPVHYILSALEKKYGSLDAARAVLAKDPRSRLRIAHGNGATARDRQALARCFGMQHVYELYGSTEAVITTALRPTDPPDSVGRAPRNVVILNERDEECVPATLDASGHITNYRAAVGEICARTPRDNLHFDGYWGNEEATGHKYRGGHFHSGDLGHIAVIDGRRYLYFDGRTEDWIRKDGENFSAESVAQYARALPGVASAVAYGVPAPVADERVAVALELQEGATFDAKEAFAWLVEQQRAGGMDPKWMPDYLWLMDELPVSPTQKVLVRELKRRHFDLSSPRATLYMRERGSERFRRMLPQDVTALRAEFAKNGRARLFPA